MNRKELVDKLRWKVEEKKIDRSSKKIKENIVDTSLKSMGIDKKKFDDDLKDVKKAGGDVSFSLNELMKSPEFNQNNTKLVL